jgi:hypothetical protein
MGFHTFHLNDRQTEDPVTAIPNPSLFLHPDLPMERAQMLNLTQNGRVIALSPSSFHSRTARATTTPVPPLTGAKGTDFVKSGVKESITGRYVESPVSRFQHKMWHPDGYLPATSLEPGRLAQVSIFCVPEFCDSVFHP